MGSKDKIKPMLFSTMKHYSGKQFVTDFISGIIVAIIALPLSIALALASGVGPEEGIYTAIVAGFIISFFGGSRVQIAGPTAAFATIVAGIIAKNGMEGMILATIVAGVILILMGVLRLGGLIKFIPYTITTGFTAGIAVTIFIGQIKDFLGLTYPKGTATIETIDKVKALANNIGTFNKEALLIGAISLLILIVWPWISQKIPGSLVAVIVGIIVVKYSGMNVNTIGDLYTISSHLPTFHAPHFTMSGLSAAMSDGFTIAVLAAIESLLSCVVADSMINSHHRSNMELIAQGLGNIGSVLFGGIPATGAIARTAANIKNGGRTPIAGMVHSVLLILVLVFLMPYAALIPMPTIAAILFMVAYNMCQWRTFVHLCKTAPKSDIIVLVVTFILTIVFDLVIAIEIGMGLAILLFMKRMSEESAITGWVSYDPEEDPDGMNLKPLPKGVRVYEISGPMFFGDAEQIAAIEFTEETNVIILRMRGVPAVDATAMHSLEQFYERCKRHNVKLVLSHVNEQPRHTMEKDGFIEMVGEENFRPHIDAAIEWAGELVKEIEKEEKQEEKKESKKEDHKDGKKHNKKEEK